MQVIKVATVLCVFFGVLSNVPPSANAQPALEELEDRLNGLFRPRDPAPAEPAEAAAGEPGYLGLVADETDRRAGVQVLSVNAGGPAQAAGIQPGDVITAVNRRVIVSIDDMSDVLRRLSAGDKVEFEISRAGRKQTANVTLTKRPAEEEARAPADALPTSRPATASSKPSLGINVTTVTDDIRVRHGLPVRRGAFVGAVYDGSPAARAGIRVGAVVVSVDGRLVETAGDLINHIKAARPGQALELTYYQDDRLYRKTIELSGTVADATPPARPDPPLRLTPAPVFGDDRPALRKLEGVLDRIVAPPAPSTDPREVAALREQVRLLQEQVELLQTRLAELEDTAAADRAKAADRANKE